MKKTFVLRLNPLLSSADSTLRFGEDNEIVIPMAVIDQLRSYQGKPEKKRIAGKILDYLESFDIKRLISPKGMKQKNGSTLRIVQNYHDVEVKMDDISEVDRRSFQVCLGLMKDKPKQKVILVSKNPVVRIKARSLGILAEDFRDDLFPLPKDQYSGKVEIYVSSDDIDFFYEYHYLPVKGIIEGEKIKWECNMFVKMHSVDSNQSALARYKDGNLLSLLPETLYPYGIKPKNAGQRMLMECLMQNSKTAPLVIVKGSAGTGKTYCSLAAALKGIDDGTYNRILVATPSETVGNERLGFLPGDIVNKVSPYLGGIKDNLAILFSSGGKKKANHNDMTENGEYYFERGLIQIQPIGFLRGRTIVNSIFIIDETQNIDPGDIKSIVTRAAEGSKFIFLGDPTQVDNPKLNERYNGLVYLSEKMKGNPLCWQVTLGSDESVRSELSTIASEIL